MGFLNPLFLLAGTAIAIPLLIHLLHRQRVREFVFPALRYLKRTERDHARRIKLRQLLVLLLRIGAIVMLALAGARPFLRGVGTAHPPTALAVVLDNSASSGAIIGDERVLDRLKAHARSTVARANDQDRIWVVRAGSSWTVAVPGSREDALAAIDATEVSDAAGDLAAAVRRSVDLVMASDLNAREVHVVSDLQHSAFDSDAPTASGQIGGVPVLVFEPDWAPPENGSVAAVTVGGGLAPIVGLPTDVTARVGDEAGAPDTVATRLWVGDEVRGAARATPGAEVVFPVPTVGLGVMSGFVERDPDALRSDDRRYFSATAAAPPRVAIDGVLDPFLTDALDVLEASGRIGRTAGAGDALVALEGRGIRSVGSVAPAWIILPPNEPTRLPAVNQRLRGAGIPWQFVEAGGSGTRRVTGVDFPHSLDELRVTRAYRLEAPEGTVAAVHAELDGGAPWIVSGSAGDARYLILGSPLDPEWSNLPLSSLMVPTFEWAFAAWARATADVPVLLAGQRFGLPDGVTALTGPEGAVVPITDPDAGVVLDQAGLYDLIGDGEVTLLGRVAVNVPPRESDLSPVTDGTLRSALGDNAEVVPANRWERRAFTERQGPEIWRTLLAILLGMLVLESLVAAAGRGDEETQTATL